MNDNKFNIRKIILCAVLCIPLVSAVFVGIFINGNGNGSKNNNSGKISNTEELKKVEIYSSSGELIKEYDDSDTLKTYWNIISNGSEIEYSPIGEEESTSFKVKYIGTNVEDSYTFIMSSENLANFSFKDINEKYYSISSEDAKELIARYEFADANKYANAFSLKVAYSNVAESIEPQSYEWNYLRLDGENVSKTLSESQNEIKTVRVPKEYGSTMTLGFSEASTEEINITVTKDSTALCENAKPGVLSTLLNFNEDTLLNVTVSAKWYENESSDFYGEVAYNFNILYDVPSEFVLADKSGLQRGEFTVIKIKNGNANDAITAKADFMETEQSSFTYNGNQYIYIPIKNDSIAGTYEITITEFAGDSKINFNVKDKKFKSTADLMLSASTVELGTETKITEYKKMLESLNEKSSLQMLWEGKFALPVLNGNVICNFGDTMNITGASKLSEGLYIESTEGAKVTASNNGIVIFAGNTDYTGNAVIIDHGLNVYSYYFNLGNLSCKAGDTVVKGGKIGTVGTSGYTPYSDTVFYANSVGGCFVNPQTQINYGISFE